MKFLKKALPLCLLALILVICVTAVIRKHLKGLHVHDNNGKADEHAMPYTGVLNLDQVMNGLLDVGYEGYFTFEASYTLLHQNNPPYTRRAFEHNGKIITKLLSPSIELKKQAINLLYETGKYILETYDCFDE